jgi:hypothetical protein
MIHKVCSTPLQGDLSSKFKFRVYFSVTRQGLKLGISEIGVSEEDAPLTFSEFYCPTCKVTVPKEDIVIICSHCAKPLTIEEAQIPGNGGGVYCEEHITLFSSDSEGSIPLSTIFNKVIF